jgi:hypothetical protein
VRILQLNTVANGFTIPLQKHKRTGMSSFLTRSLQWQCSRRLPKPFSPLFVVPKQNFFIVHSSNERPPDFINRSRITRYEFQKRTLRDELESEAIEFGSDPYPFYRKVTQTIMTGSHLIVTSCSSITRAVCKIYPYFVLPSTS